MPRVVDNLEIATVYTSHDRPAGSVGAPGVAPFVRGASAGAARWQLRQRHHGPDIAALNAAVLDDLAGGVEAIELASVGAADMAAALDAVMVDVAPVTLAAHADAAAAQALAEHWSTATDDPGAVRGGLGVDPVAPTGSLTDDGCAALVAAAGAAAPFPGVHPIGVDSTGWARRGASSAVEVGLSMATAVAYLRILDGAGIAPADVAGRLEFTYLATADQFVTMAKLRAARRLWSRVTEVAAGTAVAQNQRALTEPVGDDAWRDVLRATVALFAAGAGGARAVTVVPFDVTGTGYSPALARRLARNTHHLLLDESHAAEIADPAGGSPYVEVLTDTVARRGWDHFQAVEAAGGMAAALDSGLVGEIVAESASVDERDDTTAEEATP